MSRDGEGKGQPRLTLLPSPFLSQKSLNLYLWIMTESRCVVQPTHLRRPPECVPLQCHGRGEGLKRKYTTHFLLHTCPNINFSTQHTHTYKQTSLHLKITSKRWKRARSEGVQQKTLMTQCRKTLKYIHMKQHNFFSFLLFLNIPWCKRKILNVKTFLADELWWRVTRNLSWSVCVCVCVCAQLRSLFLRNAHFKFRTVVLLPGMLDGSTSSQIAVKILWSLSCSMFQVWRVHFQNKEYINIYKYI